MFAGYPRKDAVELGKEARPQPQKMMFRIKKKRSRILHQN